MKMQKPTPLYPSPNDPIRLMGRYAHFAGEQYQDCPYQRGDARWAWQQGWIDQEMELRNASLTGNT